MGKGRELQPNHEQHGLIRGQQWVARTDATPPQWKQILLAGFAGPNKRVLETVVEEEREALRRDLEAKGLLGDHVLVKTAFLREPASKSQGSIQGNVFGFSGRFDSSTDHHSRLAFAWQKPDGPIEFSEIPIEAAQLVLDETAEGPTVSFSFTEEQLLTVGFSLKGRSVNFLAGLVTRFASGNSNDYIKRALVKATFKAPHEEDLQDFLRPIETKRLPQ